jgi:putative ABC transport system ATP-binding protein
MINIREMVFQYPDGGFVLRLPELRVSAGERVAVIGPSGSGKTTLLHLIAGISRPDGGAVETCGVALGSLGDAARRAFRIRRLGLVFQEFALVDHLDVRDNVLLPYRISGGLRLGAEVRARADHLIEQVGLIDQADRIVTRLSQGERQRVAVSRALIAEPELVLADEPTGNLDPENKQRVLDILCQYVDEHAATLLNVTHDHALLDRFERVVDFDSLLGSDVETVNALGPEC